MNILIVTAHPSSQGFTHQIANQYLGTKHTQGSEGEIMNLYDDQWKQGFLQFEEKIDMGEISIVQKQIQEKITKADEIIFIFPLWWGNMPAILKNFIDVNFTSGFAFKYEEGKSMPTKLLTGKQAEIFITCDGPKFYYWFKNYPFTTIWKDFILGFCGIDVQKVTIFDKMGRRSEKEKKKFLEDVTKRALR